MRVLSLALCFLLCTPSFSGPLSKYKDVKHRKLKKDAKGKTEKRPCTEVYYETCMKSCSGTTCASTCRAQAVPYCEARAKEKASQDGKILLQALSLFLGPVITFFDAPKRVVGPGEWDSVSPFDFIWNIPSWNLDLGVGYVEGGAFAGAVNGAFRTGYFGLGVNAAYLADGTDTLGEADIGPAFYLGSKHISSGIQPSLLISAGSGIEPKYGFGVRTNTTFHLNRMYLVFTPMLGKINSLWQFNLRAGLGYKINPNMGVLLAYEHRSVVDLVTLTLPSASLNSVMVYFSFRVN